MAAVGSSKPPRRYDAESYAISEGRGGNSGLGVMVRLAKALGVSPCWLCFGEGLGPG